MPGTGDYVYLHTGNHQTGAATTCEILRRVLQKLVASDRLSTPAETSTRPKLFLAFDNCWRENKNSTLMYYLALLFDLGWFSEVQVHFLVKGHTHNWVDRMFSFISRALMDGEFHTPDDLVRAMEDCKGTEIGVGNVTIMNAIADVPRWIKDATYGLSGHSLATGFLITRDDDGVRLQFQSSSGSAWFDIDNADRFFISRPPASVPSIATLVPIFKDDSELAKTEKALLRWYDSVDSGDFEAAAALVWTTARGYWAAFFMEQRDLSSLQAIALEEYTLFDPAHYPATTDAPAPPSRTTTLAAPFMVAGGRGGGLQRTAVSAQSAKLGDMVIIGNTEDELPFWLAQVTAINDNGTVTADCYVSTGKGPRACRGPWRPEFFCESARDKVDVHERDSDSEADDSESDSSSVVARELAAIGSGKRMKSMAKMEPYSVTVDASTIRNWGFKLNKSHTIPMKVLRILQQDANIKDFKLPV